VKIALAGSRTFLDISEFGCASAFCPTRHLAEVRAFLGYFLCYVDLTPR
jgi:hypothetical protein